VARAKALEIDSNASFALRAENLLSFESVFSKQNDPLQGIVENMKGVDGIISQVRIAINSRSIFEFYLMPNH